MFSFKKFLKENLDDRVHSYVRDISKNLKDHPRYGKNELTVMSGEDLINAGFAKHEEDRKKAGISDQGNDMEAYGVAMQIMKKERANRATLEEKAIEIASKHTGFPKEMMHAKLLDNLGNSKYTTMQTTQKPANDLENENEEDKKAGLRHEAAKKINLRLLSQGHALVAMDGIHAQENDALEKVDPQLPDLYKKLSLLTKGTYFFSNQIELFVKNPRLRQQGAVGQVHLDYNENDELNIYASAITFPFLVQELIKGAMEYVNHHNLLDMDQNLATKVVKNTDHFEDEPYQFLMGPQLWRYLVKCTPKEYHERMMDVQMAISYLPARELNTMLRQMVEDMKDEGKSDRTTHKIQDLLQDIEEKRRQHEMGEDQDDDSEGWSPEEDDDFPPDDFRPVRN